VLVPPNTTARVELPGDGEPVEVGSGTHEFTIAFPAPEADERPEPSRRGT
jgi:alpha-L-rhamnosidase